MLNVHYVSKRVSLNIFFKPIKILSINELRDVVEENVMDSFAESGGEFSMNYKKCGVFYILDCVQYYCDFGVSEEHLDFMEEMIGREISSYLKDKQIKEEVAV